MLEKGNNLSVDIAYLRTFEDCLYVMTVIVERAENIEEIKREIKRVHKMVQQNKFEKIQTEFGSKLL